MDALSEVLRLVGLTGAVFLDAEFSAPWLLFSSGKIAWSREAANREGDSSCSSRVAQSPAEGML